MNIRNFIKLSPGTIKAFLFMLLIIIALGFWFNTQIIFSNVRKFQEIVVKSQVDIYLSFITSVIDPRSTLGPELNTDLFENAVMNAPYPSIFTDINNKPIQGLWHNVDVAPDDTSHYARLKLRKMIEKMDGTYMPERRIMPSFETRVDTLRIYEMPYNIKAPVIITDDGGNYLYLRNVCKGEIDTTVVNAVLNRINRQATPVYLYKENNPSLIFQSPNSLERWPVIVMRKGEPLYWRDIGISHKDTSTVRMRKIKEIAQAIESRGIVYDLVNKYTVKVDKVWLFHYGDPPFLSFVGWLPILELSIILLLLFIGFIGLKNIKDAEQQSIWVGMAKETAHQLGTPITSLKGWIELLRAEPDYDMVKQSIPEMEYDVDRLTMVASRFSNIGSKPELKPTDVSEVIDEVLSYFRARVPRMGKSVELKGEYGGLKNVLGNADLLNWAFENLIKNSLSSIDTNNGLITVSANMSKNFRSIILDFKDNGRGIQPSEQKKIMRPGYTTKKRGWGLGLSLVKRIIENYHGGRIYLLESKPGIGTVFRVILPAVKN